MSGLLGALLHEDPKTVMVVGLGTGSTAGWIAEVPSIERVDVLELESAIEYVAEVCAPINCDVLRHPKVDITYGDAREALLTSRRQYDLVVSEPSNPYRAGIASLFTADFYAHVRNRLNEGGLFLQWFQGYEVDSRTVATVLKTLDAVFPEVEVWRTLKHDLLLVASVEAREIDLERLRQRVSTEPFATAMRSTWHTRSAEGVLARFIAGSDLAASLRGSPTVAVNTDDRNLLEFMLAKSVGRHGLFDVETLREGAQGLGAGRPAIRGDGPQPDWVLVERERIGAFHEQPRISSGDLGPLIRFHSQWRRGDGAAALETWTAAGLHPETDVELLGLAAAAGFMGDPTVEDLLPLLEGPYSTEASIVRGRLMLEQGDTIGAVGNFGSAVERLREVPWAHPGIFKTLFESLDRVVTDDVSLAPAVYELLGPSFAVERARDERLWLRFRVASMIGAPEFAAVLDEVEPWVPWDPWMLQQRAKVRGQMRDPRAQEALSDVGDFARNAPVPFTSIGGRRVPVGEAPPRPPAERR